MSGANGTAMNGGPAAGDRAGRVEAARRVLAERGIDGSVRAAGPEGEIAAVTGSPSLRPALAAVAEELRALGFQYVALEVGPGRHTNTDS